MQTNKKKVEKEEISSSITNSSVTHIMPNEHDPSFRIEDTTS